MRSWEMLWTHCCCRTVAVLQRCCNVSQSPSQRHRNARCTHQDQSYIHTTIATRGTPCLRTSSSDSGNLCETNYHPPHRYPPFFGTADTTVPPSFIATFLFSELPYNSFHGVISESPDIVRAGKRIMLGCGQILCLYGYGCESCLQKILGLQRVDVGNNKVLFST